LIRLTASWREIDRTVSEFTVGDRVFHQKFDNGNVTVVDGNKLTIALDRAGRSEW
jgi:DNA helicase-2/ATP-dependent DNA helicase PcrA